MEMIRTRYFLVVATLAFVLCSGQGRAQQDIDRDSYHRAVEFCRGSVPRPMALSSDRQVLCFAGGSEYVRRFFKERAVSPLFEAPPDSLYVRKIIRSQYVETDAFRDNAWTIHPRYYPTLFKTRIIHEAYPESQGEVDSMVSQLHLDIRVIYDP
jgi:hypothetical protein